LFNDGNNPGQAQERSSDAGNFYTTVQELQARRLMRMHRN